MLEEKFAKCTLLPPDERATAISNCSKKKVTAISIDRVATTIRLSICNFSFYPLLY
jgi:hypothetical protein